MSEIEYEVQSLKAKLGLAVLQLDFLSKVLESGSHATMSDDELKRWAERINLTLDMMEKY